MTAFAPIPYAPIERHAVIGDRRTAALIAADGTLDWLCIPNYGSDPVFASLLDAGSGGHFRFAPVRRSWGAQRYLDGTAVLHTRFSHGGGEVIGLDGMLSPDDERPPEDAQRVTVVRGLRAVGATARCVLELCPRDGVGALHAYFSHGSATTPGPIEFELRDGEEAWAVLTNVVNDTPWDPARARASLEALTQDWLRWTGKLTYAGFRRARVVRSLSTIRLLTYAPAGSVVAAPTTSLPERIGGDWNADYRLAWVRDGSLSMATLAEHGDLRSAQRYFDWLEGLSSSTDAPLQVVYGIDGATILHPHERKELRGYRESAPVRFQNHAFAQKQLGAFGFLLDCALQYRDRGGPWRKEYFDLVTRCADYVAAHWQETDNGIWELSQLRHHVSSRVMAWVALSRAATLADALGSPDRAARWREVAKAVHAETLAKGFDAAQGTFVFAYGTKALDASLLLIPLMSFLPANDPRVVATVDAIAAQLTIDGLVHRFVPEEEGVSSLPLGEHEGSFLLCTCWLASAYARGGRLALAEATLARVDRAVGELGLMPEGIDARSGAFLGNYPLLFTHVEYVRAAGDVERARGK